MEKPTDGNYEAIQAKAIAAKGHEVSVIAIKFRNLLHVFQNWKIHHRVVDGIHVYECNRINYYYPFHTSKINKFAKQWQFKKVFKRYVRENGMPDIVHAHLIKNAAYAVVVRDKFHLPFVITEHWSRMIKENISEPYINKTFAYDKADKVICVSSSLAENLKKKYNVQSVVIHNMVSDHFFKTPKVKRNDRCVRIISVGRLCRGKRFDLLIEAFTLCSFPNNVYLDIVGGGEEYHYLNNKIRQYALEDQVKLLGIKTPEEVNNLLGQSDFFVLSSRLETFSIVLIEAMAKGLPVVSTRCGGPETFVRKEDGILVSKDNVEELAKAMKTMVEHYQDYNADEIRQHCYDNFSQDVIANEIIAIYNEVLYNKK